MKASETPMLEFLRKAQRMIIPIYQRTYSWTERECNQLLDDILRTGRDTNIPSHFIGSVVYITDDLTYQVSSQSLLLVIDGQQRLTTLMLIIKALSSHVGENEHVEGYSGRKLQEYYLVNSLERGDKFYKLQLTQTDNDTLKTIINNSTKPSEPSIRIERNYELIKKWIMAHKEEIVAIINGLRKLMIVDISLLRNNDNPQLIFESLNSTGKELSQADLIRNYVLMGLEPKVQSKLYENYWRPMEKAFGQEAYNDRFDGFVRHYLTLKTGTIPKFGAVYDAYKNYEITKGKDALEPLLEEMYRFSLYYCRMALSQESDADLKEAFNNLEELDVDVVYPFLLEVYDDYQMKKINKWEFLKILKLTESYVFRRAICKIPTNSLNKTFATMTRGMNKDKYVENIEAYYLMLTTYKRFPNDAEFVHSLSTIDLYHTKIKNYWLLKLENHNRKEKIHEGDYTIEHIMPQNENLTDEWRLELGLDWKNIQDKYLHTLGNLTLTGYNSEYSDKPFKEKQQMPGGFAQSPLNLNEYLRYIDNWNEEHIQKRASMLSKKALIIWSKPEITSEIIESYRKKPIPSQYNLEYDPKLTTGKNAVLFQEFRKATLAIDDCVTEEFLKIYIAYKADTNFVDVIPQTNGLRLTINMRFSEIRDPKKICKDITGLGRWSNGDIELTFSDLDELPYVMFLVQQSFDKQMGGD